MEKRLKDTRSIKKITVELPLYNNMSGGIMRQLMLAQKFYDMAVEIPRFSVISGGIKHMEELSYNLNKKYNVQLRIQKTNQFLDYSTVDFKVPYSIGLPDDTFPESDVVITYSDNPYVDKLVELPQVKKVLIYMLSYGMCLVRERKNILNPKVIVMSSTNRTKDLIEKEGIKCNFVGFGFNSEKFYCDYSILKKKYAALLCHDSPDKKYDLGVKICDKLCDDNLIDGVISFGSSQSFNSHIHPKKMIKSYIDASTEQVREIFCKCSIFIMPSITEGLNLTPVESTLCGCPAVICDGAINDLFFDKKTCLIANKNDFNDIIEKSKELLLNQYYSLIFRNNIKELLKEFTWKKTISNIEGLLYGTDV
jgi:glycosyltransferase involved in cell wall biosynthesis